MPTFAEGRIANSERSARLRWLAEHAAPLAAAVFLLVMSFQFLKRPLDGDWHKCYVRAAQRMQAGERIHHIEMDAYAYPPLMAALVTPLASLPPAAANLAWYLVNAAALCCAFRAAWTLIGGPPLASLSGKWQWVFWIGALLCVRFLEAPLANKQFDTIIAAALFSGCVALMSGRESRAGLLLGAAAGMKCTPLLFLPYLLWRRSFRAAGVLAVSAVGLNLLPDVLYPQASGRLYLADWYTSFLATVGSEAPGKWFSDLILNQSLAGFFNRIVQAGGLAELSAEQVSWIRLLTYGAIAVLFAATIWRYGFPGRRLPDASAAGQAPDWRRVQLGLEAGGIVCLMLLASPMSSKAHYVVLMLPALVFARAFVERSARGLGWYLAALIVSGPLCSKGITGKPLGDLLLFWGLPTWHVLLFWWTMLRLRPVAEAAEAVPGSAAEPVRAAA